MSDRGHHLGRGAQLARWGRRRDRPLRRIVRFLALAVLVALVPLVALGVLTTTRSEAAVREEVESRLRLSTEMSGALVAQQLESVVALVEAAARRPRLVQAVATGDPAGFDLAEIDAQVRTLLESRRDLSSSGLLDLRGILRATPNGGGIVGVDFSQRDYFRGLITSGRTYVSESFQSAQEGNPLIVTTATYVRELGPDGRSTGNPLAVLVAGIRLDDIQALARRLARVQGVDLWVADQRDKLVAGPRRLTPMLPVVESPIAAARSLPIHQLGDLDLDGTESLVVRERVATFGWQVFATLSRDDALAGVDAMRATVLAIGVPLALVVCVGILLLLRTQGRQWRAEAALAIARDEAQEASRQKSAFLANMSHEIRTPMNGVVGMTTLLLGTELDDAQREYAQTASRSAEALLEVIDDILDFSKVEAGRLELEATEVDLRSVVEDVAQLLAATAEGKGIDLVCQVDSDVPTVVIGDPARLRQVLTNLVGNAVKFTATGEVVVRVGATGTDNGTVHVRFEVRDTGTGIDQEALPHLFVPFAQADVSTTRNYGGTGLGLSISQRLVEMMGGRIEVRSTLGEGSTFWFTVPLGRGAGELGRPPTPRHDLAGVHVLVVHDHPTGRAVLTEMLDGWGLRAAAVDSVDGALTTMHRAAEIADPYGVVVISNHLPGRGGLDLVQALRRDHDVAVRIIVLTSSARPEEAAVARAAGADAHLTRPVRQSQLYDVLTSVIGARPERPAGPREGGDDTAQRYTGRLLLAEDNPVNQRVAQLMLERMGFSVDVVGDGAAAVAASATGDYDAVLMDCQMPVLDGFDATRAIRGREAGNGARLPVIALTASALESDRERCRQAGMDDHIAKPIRPEALARALGRFRRPPDAG